VTIAQHQAVAIGTPLAFVLLEELMHLHLNGLAQYLLSSVMNHDIQEVASLELLPKASDFRIDRFLWNSAAKSRSLTHGVSIQPLLGQLYEKNFKHQKDSLLYF